MVDPISTRIVTGGDASITSSVRVSAAAAPAPVARHEEPAAVVVKAGSLAQELASSAPIDLDRVARIKKAIDQGTFPILPATVADRLIALKFDWHPHAQAVEPRK